MPSYTSTEHVQDHGCENCLRCICEDCGDCSFGPGATVDDYEWHWSWPGHTPATRDWIQNAPATYAGGCDWIIPCDVYEDGVVTGQDSFVLHYDGAGTWYDENTANYHYPGDCSGGGGNYVYDFGATANASWTVTDNPCMS